MVDTRRLRDLRGVGPSIQKDLERLGVLNVDQLKKRDGRKLYDELCRLTNSRQDPCVEDAFVCAVAQANDPHLPREKCDWWYWTRLRKARER